MAVVSFEEARAVVHDQLEGLGAESVDLLAALGRILAEDVVSPRDLPAFNMATESGVAVVTSELQGCSEESPLVLRLGGTVAPGSAAPRDRAPGETLRVSPGSQLPPWADSVVEDARVGISGGEVSFTAPAAPGAHMLGSGAYFTGGQKVIEKGKPIHPEEINILSALGIAEVPVVRRPSAGVLVTGSELMDVGGEALPGKIWGSNLYHLMARVKAVGASPMNFGVIRDAPDEIQQVLSAALSCEVVLTAGGLSRGPGDSVRQALDALGAEVLFEETSFRPGRYFTLARKDGTLIFCLPGFSRSIITLFHLFVRPALWELSGRKRLPEEEVAAILEEDLITKPGTMRFIFSHLRRTVTGFAVRPLREIARGGFVTSDSVNALIVVPEDVAYLKSDYEVTVIPLYEI
jgi:molybdopterin molybdotransferase